MGFVAADKPVRPMYHHQLICLRVEGLWSGIADTNLYNPTYDIKAAGEKLGHQYSFIELFCLQNSLIVIMQPQVSGKVGSLVGWVDHVRYSRRLSNFPEKNTTRVSAFHVRDVGYLYIK